MECVSLENVSMNLSKLKNGYCMFIECKNLTSFNIEMPLLKNGNHMFDDCEQLQSFDADISALEYGRYMFLDCKSLTSFNGNLSNLKDGEGMFENCKLDLKSLKCIATTLPRADGESKITLGLESTDDEFAKYIQMIKHKGWAVEV